MRRKDREITGRENIEPILQACKVCRVAMTGTDGWPYVIPMNFGYTWTGAADALLSRRREGQED